MKILFLPKYHREGSSSRYRYYNYFPWFEKDAHEIVDRPLLYNGYVVDLYANKKYLIRKLMLFIGILRRIGYLLLNKKKFDVIIIEKELFTFVPYFIEKFLLKGEKFILDFDDNISARYDIGLARTFLKNKITNLVRLSSATTVGNNWYRELFKSEDQSKIYYLPTVIDRELYGDESDKVIGMDDLNIVWIGSFSTVKYLKLIDNVLVNLQKVYNFKLIVIGAKVPLKCSANFVDWEASTEIMNIKKAQIGIMPLENTEWEKGKCGFKLIQYMACGLPVVASGSPANEEIVNSNCGFLANNNQDWLEHLSFLLANSSTRSNLGLNGRNRIFRDYSYQSWAPKFIEIVKNVVFNPKR